MRDIGGEALDRLDAAVERLGHLTERAREMADFVGPIGEIRDLLARSYASTHAFGRLGELSQGFGDRIGLRKREHEHHCRRDQEVSQKPPTFAGDHLVDVVALGRQDQGASDHARPLNRHRDGNDGFAVRIDADDRTYLPRQRFGDLGQRFAVVSPVAESARRLGADEHPANRAPRALEPSRVLVRRVAHIRARCRPTRAHGLRVEQQQPIAVVDARACMGRRHQTVQHRPDPLWIDREFDRILVVLRGRRGFARRQLE